MYQANYKCMKNLRRNCKQVQFIKFKMINKHSIGIRHSYVYSKNGKYEYNINIFFLWNELVTEIALKYSIQKI